MPSWDDLLKDFHHQPDDQAKGEWLLSSLRGSLAHIGRLRGTQDEPRNVLLYGSAFLQKAQLPAELVMITNEDLNGLMSAIYGMNWGRGLTLVLHTPGGVTNAAESIVSYLRSKFSFIEVVIPAFAMSAGTMISLASDQIVMGRQSQLGPIDPQMSGVGAGRTVSANAIVEQFARARSDILANQATAHVWAPIVQSMGPALLQEAQNALDYSESMVARWLARYMYKGRQDASARGSATARHFNDASAHKSHGRRIDREECRSKGLNVDDLEANQELQEAVLTSYHLMTIMFENSGMTKGMWTGHGRVWVKNWRGMQPVG